ncbi:lytic transglycosylase domain-containing protein [Cryobacterium mannosilyticum]|uniref:aggregation-promoting factor C-terminal-like domain-containing protein n=1 Tax=Cryobacterium mannosilyticum TaxID=1259190 RepID=UPI001F5453C4|nr:lytic transglycosylase domain-containing protein [Cryobacterium mannosilyticum]
MPRIKKTSSFPSVSTPGSGRTRHRDTHRRQDRKRILAAGAFLLVTAVVGTGFVMQSVAAAQDVRIKATRDLAESTGVHPDQLIAYDNVMPARAASTAKGALNEAVVVMAAAEGKADATALAASVASLTHFTLLAPERVFELVDLTKAESANVQASTAETDRIAAEQAAAAAAAAAAQAAAEAQAAAAAAAAAEAANAASAKPSAPSRPSAPTDPSGAQAIARDLMMAQYGWGGDQFGCLVSLWARESGWNVNAYNSSSGATGIPQALPGSKMASAGADWQTNPATQITWGLGYIAGRYGTPCGAWDHSQSAGWY